MSNSSENKSLSRFTILLAVVLLMLSSAGLLHYLSLPKTKESKAPNKSKLMTMSLQNKEKEFVETTPIQPKQVQVILKVTPKSTVFDLSMIKPEVLNLAYSEKGEVQMMMDEGIQYKLQLQATNGQKELIEIQPSGQMEVHYIRF